MTSSANLENLLDDNPSPDDVDFLEQQIYGYNVGHTAIRRGREPTSTHVGNRDD